MCCSNLAAFWQPLATGKVLLAVLSAVDQKLILGQSTRNGKATWAYHTNYNALNFGLHLIQVLEVLGVPQDWLVLGDASFNYVAKATQVVPGLLKSGRKNCHDLLFIEYYCKILIRYCKILIRYV